jgi:N-methylhydantoinase B
MVVLSVPDAASGKRDVTVLEPMFGGGGATRRGPGPAAIDSGGGFLKNTPVESMEAHIPVLTERYELLPDSAGPGKHRGGWGVQFDFRILRPESIVTARGIERTRFEPWGLAGGHAATRTRTFVNAGTEREREIGRIDVLHLEPGDIVSVWTSGGGGYGNPLERDPAAVSADVRSGLLSASAAKRDYGVVMRDGTVDPQATAALRAGRMDSLDPLALFDLGPSRREYETVWTEGLSEALASFLLTLPPPFRAYAKREIHRRIDRDYQAAPDPSAIPVLWAEISRQMGNAR